MATLQDTNINDTGFITMPAGNNSQRPTATTGMLRYNNQSADALEFYDGVNWRPVTGVSKGAVGTGGQSITYGNGGIMHMFTSVGSHTFTPTFSGTVQVLVVVAILSTPAGEVSRSATTMRTSTSPRTYVAVLFQSVLNSF